MLKLVNVSNFDKKTIKWCKLNNVDKFNYFKCELVINKNILQNSFILYYQIVKINKVN